MNSIVARLEETEARVASVLDDAFTGEQIPDLSDDDVVRLLAVAGRIQRRLDAVVVEAAVQVRGRSEGLREERLTTRYGCAKPLDLVQVLLGTDRHGASRVVKAAGLNARYRRITDGEFQPARFPALRRAMLAGELSLAGVLAATGPLEKAAKRISDDDRRRADIHLAALASGRELDDPDFEATEVEVDGAQRPSASPEELGVYAQVIVAYLDPDGAEPSAEEDARGRFLTIGALKNGVHPVRGALLPEAAGQLKLLMDSILNPRNDGPTDPTAAGDAPDTEVGRDAGVRFEPSGDDDLSFDHAPEDPTLVDGRTRPQRLHDALAMILAAAAASGGFPQVGGAAPTLVVTATAEDLTRGAGWATILSTGDPIPVSSAAQTGCAGGIQRVLFDDHGRIVSIGTSNRIFNALQRRAITVRDGGCVIPGCTVPADWCEIHHVQEWADGGPTHTDNGVLLCWWHHRTLHLTEWVIRMNRGVPEVRGPAWWDPHQSWHRARSPHLAIPPRRRKRTPA
ncbi:DUF222 domain-containing protein [Microbacterium sp. ZKA21]|uniref:HNH endonuclease signature motif containing protein n=1 Tax=Microbacterium sp. ZKA21 TaxID=3381694 RepID=UPI003D2558D2